MSRLEEISADQLREYLDEVEGKQATLRIVAGINYKEGVSQTDLSDWYCVSRTTIHNWLSRLERLETEDLEDVIYDDARSGRPTKLTEEQWDELVTVLDNSPNDVGFDAPTWTPKLVQHYIRESYDIEYSLRHIRELLNQAGYVWKTARPTFVKSDERARQAFREGFKKTDS